MIFCSVRIKRGIILWKTEQFCLAYYLCEATKLRLFVSPQSLPFKQLRLYQISYVSQLIFIKFDINLLKPTGYVMHQQFNIEQL